MNAKSGEALRSVLMLRAWRCRQTQYLKIRPGDDGRLLPVLLQPVNEARLPEILLLLIIVIVVFVTILIICPASKPACLVPRSTRVRFEVIYFRSNGMSGWHGLGVCLGGHEP